MHNCTKCNDNYPIKIKINNYYNCYHNCSYYYYFDINNNYNCTINDYCPDEYPIIEERECKNVDQIKKELEDLIKNEAPKKEEIKYYDIILKNIENIYISKNYNTSGIDNGKDEIIKTGKVKIIFTTTENQKNNINSDMTNIDLGDCENSLRQSYNLINGEILYIKMLDISQEGMRIPKIE